MRVQAEAEEEQKGLQEVPAFSADLARKQDSALDEAKRGGRPL